MYTYNSVSAFTQGRDLPIYYVESQEKVAAITFDCAWEADDIPDILATLKKENIKASFFMVGYWAEKHPDAVKAMFDAGHDVGSHGYSHLRMGALDRSKINNDIQKCDVILKGITGVKPDLFRPPYGDYSNDVVGAARELGYYTIQWNVDSLDWKPEITRDQIMNRITTKIKPGSIMLFHNDTPHTAAMLPDIISTLKTDGYSFKPVSQLILRNDYFIDEEGCQKAK